MKEKRQNQTLIVMKTTIPGADLRKIREEEEKKEEKNRWKKKKKKKKNKELLRSFSSNQAKRSHGIGDGLDNMDGHVSWLQNTSNSRNQGERKFIGRFRERRGKFELFSKRKTKYFFCLLICFPEFLLI